MGNKSDNYRETFGANLKTKASPQETLGMLSENHRGKVCGTLGKTFGTSMQHIKNHWGATETLRETIGTLQENKKTWRNHAESVKSQNEI
jgi:hypothetical protein